MEKKKCVNRYICLFLLMLSTTSVVCAKEVNASISLYNLFSPNTDMENGIKGTVNAGGEIEVKVYEKSLDVLV